MRRYRAVRCHLAPLLQHESGHGSCVADSCTGIRRVLVQIAEWREEGKAEIVPGVLFIDEVSGQSWSRFFTCMQTHDVNIVIVLWCQRCMSQHTPSMMRTCARSALRCWCAGAHAGHRMLCVAGAGAGDGHGARHDRGHQSGHHQDPRHRLHVRPPPPASLACWAVMRLLTFTGGPRAWGQLPLENVETAPA